MKKVKKRKMRERKSDEEVIALLTEVKTLAYGKQKAWLKKNKLTTSHLTKWRQRFEAEAKSKKKKVA